MFSRVIPSLVMPCLHSVSRSSIASLAPVRHSHLARSIFTRNLTSLHPIAATSTKQIPISRSSKPRSGFDQHTAQKAAALIAGWSASVVVASCAEEQEKVTKHTSPLKREIPDYSVMNDTSQQALDKGASIVGEKVMGVISTGIPEQITAGFVMGFCMGFAAKKSLKIVAVGLGGILLCVQALSYNGYVQTKWDQVSGDFVSWLDVNGDGKIDSKDVNELFHKATKVVGYNMPVGSGWVAGWIFGLRSG
eukprot:m.336439 g.336439  ORF g.336439 m.336439 type:complete len:249 (+) comp17852_c0_seq1:110-856(+)